MREAVPVKWVSISAGSRPTASKICAPQYDWKVEIPILENVFSSPLPIALTIRCSAVSRSRSTGRRPRSASSSSDSNIR
jgi:hypothetical protein